MDRDELIRNIKSAIDTNGGTVCLSLACGNYHVVRFNPSNGHHEVKWSPCWDVESWERLEDLNTRLLTDIANDLNII